MLYFPSTKINLSQEWAVASGVTIAEEGLALTLVTPGNSAPDADISFATGLQGGTQAVQPTIYSGPNASSVANEHFVGVSLSQQLNPTTLPAVDTFIAPGTATITLSHPALSLASIRVYDKTTAAALVGSGTAPAAAGDFQWVSTSPQTITLDATNITDNLVVIYEYSPTLLEVWATQGMVPAGQSVSSSLGSIGVITNGVIYTTCFDTSVDWTGSPAVYTGANGVFTTSAATTKSTNPVSAFCVSDPLDTVINGHPFLGLSINTP